MDIVVYQKDFAKDVAAAYAPKAFTLSPLPCKAGVTTSADVSDADYNILRDRLKETLDSKKIPEKLIAALVALAKHADQEIAVAVLVDPSAAQTILADFQKEARAKVKEFEAEVTKAFGDSWTAFVKDHQAYKTYKIKIAIDASVAGVSLAGSIASLATAATPAAPVTLVLGIYGIVKNATKLIVVTRNAMMEAETVAEELVKDCESLKKKMDKLAKLEEEAKKKDELAKKEKHATEEEMKQLEKDAKDAKKKAEAEKKKTKLKEKLKELAVSFLNKISGDVVGVKISTVEGIASKCSLYGNKCRGVQEGTRAIATDYLQAIDKMLALGKYCDELEAHFVKYSSTLGFSPKATAEIGKLNAKIKTARNAWTSMQESMKQLNLDVEASEKRYQTNAEKQKKFAETAKKAQEAFKTANWAEAGRWCGVAVDIGLTAGANGASAWSNAEKAATTSLKLLTIFEKEAITELKKKM